MQNKNYECLADVYSYLMRDVDYESWSEYIKDLMAELFEETPVTLEIASGTGRLSKYLSDKIPNLVISDLSIQMLKKSSGLPAVCADMTQLPFKPVFDFAFSAFDSVNYLTTKKKFKAFLNSAAYVIKPDGYLTFDVALERMSRKCLSLLNRTETYKGVEYSQISFFDEEKRIHYNKFKFKLENGTIVNEIHKQKIYHLYEYFEMIEKSGFYVENCYDAFTVRDAGEKSFRVQFILKRKNDA